MGYLGAPDIDPLSKISFQDMSVGTYGDITYGKTATMLITLEKIVGEQTLQKALHTYFMRYRFTASHAGRLHEDGQRSRRAGPELVLEPGGLRHAGHGLRGDARRFQSGEVVG